MHNYLAAHRVKITIIVMNCLDAFVLAMLYKQFPHRVVCFGFLVRFKSPVLIRADTQRKRAG